jgi:hypothetical protein
MKTRRNPRRDVERRVASFVLKLPNRGEVKENARAGADDDDERPATLGLRPPRGTRG